MGLPLEDTFADIIGKAQRGRKVSDSELASRAGISEMSLVRLKAGEFDREAAAAVCGVLGLDREALEAIGTGAYIPSEVSVKGLEMFTTPYQDMTVNSYLLRDLETMEAVAFDTGADATPMLEFLTRHGLLLKMVFLSHTHGDHIWEIDRVLEKTGAKAYVGDLEPRLDGVEAFPAGKIFRFGSRTISTRLTCGHSLGGITYVVQGLGRPLAVVGDAVFAGSIGGGLVSYDDALRTNLAEIMTLPESTVLACGHGPLTTVGEQKSANPFLASRV